ncbi:hypothetical protein C6A87_018915 [Mycobacterium sp. ITM-2016-00317]|uniref:hypothetical protein n=1 Tax=Mycobacterium sp. ITM-2016-00317 TaxID=2099694 RepID=UPI00287F8081|nr:hypothetical protein [Mycobacterium sp. ITM-2016-00317]WNG85972.1 hypothetical protein C6A87_018915 [Mycobacterium sp. ITM-2016-00317]
MPSFRRRDSVIDADRVEESTVEPGTAPDADNARTLAEKAEAEAAEAEALAAAARARARAIRLRQEAETEPATGTDEGQALPDTGEAALAFEAAADPDAPARRVPGRQIARYTAVVLAILATCALIGATVYMVVQHRAAVADRQEQAEYSAAARQAVISLMSLDHTNAQEDVDRIIENSTGQFRDEFEGASKDFVQIAQESKVVTDVSVNASAVQKMDGGTADVLVAAQSRVTNSSGAKEQPRSWRLIVSLQREGDQIKMSKVEFVP